MAASSVKAAFFCGEEQLHAGTLQVICLHGQTGSALLLSALREKAVSLKMAWADCVVTVQKGDSDQLCRGPAEGASHCQFPWETAWAACKIDGYSVHVATPRRGESSYTASTAAATAAATVQVTGASLSIRHAVAEPSYTASTAAATAAAAAAATTAVQMTDDASQTSSTTTSSTKKAREAAKRKASRELACAAEPAACRPMRPIDVLNAIVRGGKPDLELEVGHSVGSKEEAKLLVAEYCESAPARNAKNRTAAIYSLGKKAKESWYMNGVQGLKPVSTETRLRGVCHDYLNCGFLVDWKQIRVKSDVGGTSMWKLVQFEPHNTSCAMPRRATAYTSKQLAHAYVAGGGSRAFSVMGNSTFAPIINKFTKNKFAPGRSQQRSLSSKVHRAKVLVKLKETGSLTQGLRHVQRWLRELRDLGNYAELLPSFDADTMNRLNVAKAKKQHELTGNAEEFDASSVPKVPQNCKYFHGYCICFEVALTMLKLKLLDGPYATDVCHNIAGPGVFFFLVGYDANRNIVYLAFMFTIATEATSTWALFFEACGEFFGDYFDNTHNRLLTDADKGCFKSSDLKLTYIGLFLCHYHLFANLRKNRGIKAEDIDYLIAATRLKDRNAALSAWNKMPHGALQNYLRREKIDAAHVLPAVAGRMRGRVTSNQAESANKAIRDARTCGNYFFAGKLIVEYAATNHRKLFAEANAHDKHLAPRPHQDLVNTFMHVKGLQPTVVKQANNFIVRFGTEGQVHTVNLDNLTCSCAVHECDSTLCPCMVAALDYSEMHGNVASNVDVRCTTARWRAQRGLPFQVPTHFQPELSTSDSDETMELPVDVFMQRGRPRTTRREISFKKRRCMQAAKDAATAAVGEGPPRATAPPTAAAEASARGGDTLTLRARQDRAIATVARNGGSDAVQLPGEVPQSVPARAVFREWKKDHEADCAGCGFDTNKITGEQLADVLFCFSCARTLCSYHCQQKCMRLRTTVSSGTEAWVLAHVAVPLAEPSTLVFCQDCWFCHKTCIAEQYNLLAALPCGSPTPPKNVLLIGACRAVLSWKCYKSWPAIPATLLVQKVQQQLSATDEEAYAAVVSACDDNWSKTGSTVWRFVKNFASTASSTPLDSMVQIKPLPLPDEDNPSDYQRLATTMASHPEGMPPVQAATEAAAADDDDDGSRISDYEELVRLGVQLGHFNLLPDGNATLAQATLEWYPSAMTAARICRVTRHDFFCALLQEFPQGVPLHMVSVQKVRPLLEARFGGQLKGRDSDIKGAIYDVGDGLSDNDDGDESSASANKHEDLSGWSCCTLCRKKYDDKIHSLSDHYFQCWPRV